MEEVDDYNYVSRLCWLLGKDALNMVRVYVRRGDIDAAKVWNMVRHPRVLAVNIYDDNRHLDLEERFERVLEFWYEQTLFRLQPQEVQALLVDVLTKARCSPKVIDGVKAKMTHQVVDQITG